MIIFISVSENSIFILTWKYSGKCLTLPRASRNGWKRKRRSAIFPHILHKIMHQTFTDVHKKFHHYTQDIVIFCWWFAICNRCIRRAYDDASQFIKHMHGKTLRMYLHSSKRCTTQYTLLTAFMRFERAC